MNDDFTIIRSMSGQSNSLVIPKIYLTLTGDLNSALVLSQCVFWSDKGGRPDGFIYKTKAEWENETSLTRHEFDTAKQRLEESGFVEFQVKRANGHGTLHFRVNTDNLMTALRTIVFASEHTEDEIDAELSPRKPETGELRKPETGELLTVNNSVKYAVKQTAAEFFASFPNPALAAINHPMIQLWQNITGNGRLPGKQNWEPVIDCMQYIVDTQGGEDKAKEYLRPYWLRWKNGRRKTNGQPFDKFGINWLTEWAIEGQDPNTIPNGTDSRDGGLGNIHFDNL